MTSQINGTTQAGQSQSAGNAFEAPEEETKAAPAVPPKAPDAGTAGMTPRTGNQVAEPAKPSTDAVPDGGDDADVPSMTPRQGGKIAKPETSAAATPAGTAAPGTAAPATEGAGGAVGTSEAEPGPAPATGASTPATGTTAQAAAKPAGSAGPTSERSRPGGEGGLEALRNAADARGVAWKPGSEAGLAAYGDAIDKPDADLVDSAANALRGDEKALPARIGRLEGQQPVEAVTANAKIYAGDGVAQTALDPQTRTPENVSDTAKILREELAESAFQKYAQQSVDVKTSKGDFGAEVQARADGEYASKSDAERAALRTENDTVTVDTEDGQVTGEANGTGSFFTRKDGVIV